MRVAFDPARLWLVGGGLAEPWTYADLAAESAHTGGDGEVTGVADALVRLTRALRRGEDIDLGEAEFAREGVRPREAPAGASNTGDRAPGEFVLQPDTTIALRTSGSTGRAALVKHRAENLWRTVRVDERHREAVWGLAFNPTHIAGVQVFLQAVANGNMLVNLWGVPRAEIMRRCMEWKVTHLSATPTFYRLLLPLEEKLPAIQSISLGGERADEGLLAQLRSAFPTAKVRNIYASTETGSLFVATGDEFEVPPRLADQVRCADGRLWLHHSLLGQGSCGGEWHDTADLVVVTSTCPVRFRIVGRAAGWINVGGEKVNPAEVEEMVLTHPAVSAARVHGRKNSVTGNILAIDVMVRGALTQQELNGYLEVRLPAHKRPRIIKFVNTLDLTRTGKLVRHD